MKGSISPLTQQVLELLALRCVSLFVLLTLLFMKSCVDEKLYFDYTGGSVQIVLSSFSGGRHLACTKMASFSSFGLEIWKWH